MNVLITGAFGDTGKHITMKFLEAGETVIPFVLKKKKNLKLKKQLEKLSNKLPGEILVQWGDLRNKNTMENIFKKHEIDAVVHFGFVIPPVSELHPNMAMDVNINGTRNIIELMKEHAPDAPIVFSSSATVVNENPRDNELVIGTGPPSAFNVYTLHKVACEKMLVESELDWRILRLSAVMSLPLKFDLDLLSYSMRIPPYTKIEPVHVKDLAIAVYNATRTRKASRKVFVIAGGARNRMIYKDYWLKMLNAHVGKIDEQKIPWHLFAKESYPLYWYDTRESQEILKYQNRSPDEYFRELNYSRPWWIKLPPNFLKKLFMKRLFPTREKVARFVEVENNIKLLQPIKKVASFSNSIYQS